MPYQPTSEQLLKALDDVHYEIAQLLFTTSPIAGDTVIQNAVVESRLLHVRTLLDFFAYSARNNDDVLATHYGVAHLPVQIDATYESRLNKDLAHLTYSRVERSAADKSWPVNLVLAPVLERCNEFIDHIISVRTLFGQIDATEWRHLQLRIRNRLQELETQ